MVSGLKRGRIRHKVIYLVSGYPKSQIGNRGFADIHKRYGIIHFANGEYITLAHEIAHYQLSRHGLNHTRLMSGSSKKYIMDEFRAWWLTVVYLKRSGNWNKLIKQYVALCVERNIQVAICCKYITITDNDLDQEELARLFVERA